MLCEILSTRQHRFEKCNSCNFIIPRMKNKTVIHMIKEHNDKPKKQQEGPKWDILSFDRKQTIFIFGNTLIGYCSTQNT
jgi:hypothetical protein